MTTTLPSVANSHDDSHNVRVFGAFELLNRPPLRKCSNCGLEAHSEADLDFFCKAPYRYPYFRYNLCKDCQSQKIRLRKTNKVANNN